MDICGQVEIVILAGGKGSRMRSDVPKVLHTVAGIPMLKKVVDATFPLCGIPNVVVGPNKQAIVSLLGATVRYVDQAEPLGTGDGLIKAVSGLSGSSARTIVVLVGDQPFVNTDTLKKLIAFHEHSEAVTTLGIARIPKFAGVFSVCRNYSRVICDKYGRVKKIVEWKSATEEERSITDVSMSYHVFDLGWLREHLFELTPNTVTGEYQLTEYINLALRHGDSVAGYHIDDPIEALGANTPEELEVLKKIAISGR